MSECKSASAASKGSELARDSHQRVVWMNDALPDLRALRALGRRFDLILLSAVWMHVAPRVRERAFRILSELLGPSGLLAITLRLGETAPGLVIERTDDYVDIPFGAVGLYWLKQYLPLVLHHRLPQRPSGPGGYGWAKEAFHRLRTVSPSDLRLGARFDADRAVILTRAINDACGNIEKMPVRYITHPGSQ